MDPCQKGRRQTNSHVPNRQKDDLFRVGYDGVLGRPCWRERWSKAWREREQVRSTYSLLSEMRILYVIIGEKVCTYTERRGGVLMVEDGLHPRPHLAGLRHVREREGERARFGALLGSISLGLAR